jgi:hypothetical protein
MVRLLRRLGGMTAGSRLIVLWATIAAIACAGHNQPGVGGDAYLVVDNQSLTDYNMYIVPEGGLRTPIGDALSLHKTVIRVPDSWLGGSGTVQFVGLPKSVGPRTTRSERLHVAAGDTVALTIVQ